MINYSISQIIAHYLDFDQPAVFQETGAALETDTDQAEESGLELVRMDYILSCACASPKYPFVNICGYRVFNFQINHEPTNTFKFKVCWKLRRTFKWVERGEVSKGSRDIILFAIYGCRFPYQVVWGQMSPIPLQVCRHICICPQSEGTLRYPGLKNWINPGKYDNLSWD